MPRRLHKGLQQHRALAIARGEVLRDPPCGERQHLRGEVLHLHPGQDQKPRIVEHTPQMGLACGWPPADPAITRGHLPGRRTEAERTQYPLLPLNQVAQLRPRQGRVAQVVPARDQPVPQPRGGLVGDRFQAQTGQLPGRSHQRPLRRPGSGLPHQSPPIAVAVECRRQRDQPRTVQTQQPHPAAHQLRPTQACHATPGPRTPAAPPRRATAGRLRRSPAGSSPGPPRSTAVHTACQRLSRSSALAPSVVIGADFTSFAVLCPAQAASTGQQRCG